MEGPQKVMLGKNRGIVYVLRKNIILKKYTCTLYTMLVILLL